MKKVKLERPCWWSDHFTVTSEVHVGNAAYHIVDGKNEWNENFEPINKMFEDAREIRSYGDQNLWRHVSCKAVVYGKDLYNISKESHKALLINIEPIKQETREEKLEALLMEIYEGGDDKIIKWETKEVYMDKIKDLLEIE